MLLTKIMCNQIFYSMKRTLNSTFKAAALGVFALALSTTASAQQTTGDVTKEADIVEGTTVTGGAVRVIDNKGTRKYLQVKNGLTIISNTTNDVTTTTWQLGGDLTDSTDIDFNSNAFTLQNVPLNSGSAATAADADADGGGGTGFTVLVRNEATGGIEKVLASSLIQSGHEKFDATANQTAYPLTGSPNLPSFEQVWVYRNGAKLIADEDYTVAGSTVTLVTTNFTVYANDVIEVHFVR